MSKQKKLNILNNIKVAKPCHESWQNMTGNEREKHCLKCDHCVTNLSVLTKKQAEKIIAQRGLEKMCIRYNYSKDGNIIFKNQFSIKTLWHSIALSIVAVSALFGISITSFAETTINHNSEQNQNTQPSLAVEIGEVAVPESSATPTATPEEHYKMGIIPAPLNDEITMGKPVPTTKE